MIMLDFLKATLSDLKEVWKEYKLTDWFSMTAGAFIFVAGYFFGTKSWRKGSFSFFVALDIITGTAGFVYFCYKGLQLFGDAHDKLISLISEEEILARYQMSKSRENYVTENNYVLAYPMSGQAQNSGLENNNVPAEDDSEKDCGNYFEINAGNYTNMDLIRHANDLDPDGSYFKSNSLNKHRHVSTGGLYVPENDFEARYAKSTLLERRHLAPMYVSEPSLSQRTPSFMLQTPSGGQTYVRSPFSFYKDPSTLEDTRSLEDQGETPVKGDTLCIKRSSGNFERNRSISTSSISPVLPENKNFGELPRIIHNSYSESMLTAIQNDFTEYYQVPKNISLSSPYLEIPHGKPRDLTKRPLPPIPLPTKLSSSFKENIHPSLISAKMGEILKPPPLQSRLPLLKTRISLPLAQVYPRGSNFPFRTPPRQLNYPEAQVRSTDPVKRVQSHPVNFRYRSPPHTVQPTVPRSRLTPPMQERTNTLARRYSQSPPAIPRKMRSSR